MFMHSPSSGHHSSQIKKQQPCIKKKNCCDCLNIIQNLEDKIGKLKLKSKEKDRIIAELQEFNQNIRIEYEKNQEDLLKLIEEKNHNIDLKDNKITSLEANLSNIMSNLEFSEKSDDNKVNSTPISKSKSNAFELASTKNSFKNQMGKSCKSQRSLNFEGNSSDIFDFPKKNEKSPCDLKEKLKKQLNDTPVQEFQQYLDSLFLNLLSLLSVNYLDEILPALNFLLRKARTYDRFHENLIKVITDCSPEGCWVEKVPSLKDQWKWIKKMMGEYMSLKKNEKQFAMSMSQFISPKLSQRFYEEQ